MKKGIDMKVRHSKLHRMQNGEPLKMLPAHSTPTPGFLGLTETIFGLILDLKDLCTPYPLD